MLLIYNLWNTSSYERTTNTVEYHYNCQQSRAQMVVENPFGHLKGQRQSLLKQMDCYDIQRTTNAIGSCVVLHNLYEKLSDACQPQWIHTDSDAPVAPTGTPSAMTTIVGSNANTIVM